jgi:hypothetical protein
MDGAFRVLGIDESCNTVLVRKSEKNRPFVENGHGWGALDLSEVLVTGSYERSTEPLHSIFLDYLSNCLLPSKAC